MSIQILIRISTLIILFSCSNDTDFVQRPQGMDSIENDDKSNTTTDIYDVGKKSTSTTEVRPLVPGMGMTLVAPVQWDSDDEFFSFIALVEYKGADQIATTFFDIDL